MHLKLLATLLSFSISAAFAGDCLSTSIDERMNNTSHGGRIFKKENLSHTLAFAHDSCGSAGCEIFVFTEVWPGCFVETLNAKAFLVGRSFSSRKLSLKKDGKLRVFRYYPGEMRFK